MAHTAHTQVARGLDEFQKLVRRMNPPRVEVDNCSCANLTLVKVDSVNMHGLLLQVVQILTDLDLTIHKAYISSDGGWFMDVFHVTDSAGEKITDEEIVTFIRKSIDDVTEQFPGSVGVQSAAEHSYTSIELTGTDRPGLMSEVSALLANMGCNVVAAELWTHNRRVACLLCVTDEVTGCPIRDPEELGRMKEGLSRLLKGDAEGDGAARTDFPLSVTHTERRLHQMMLADRDYERADELDEGRHDACGNNLDGKITVDNWREKGYSVVNIDCRKRPKLLFDILCTLTDMEYVVFHATFDSDDQRAYQEYYIRHLDGRTLDSEAERRRVIKCLRAAIERRVSEGLRLELCTNDRVGLLSDVTRIFREHGLRVARADISTKGDKASNVFYFKDSNAADVKMIEAIRRKIGQTVLNFSHLPALTSSPKSTVRFRFSLCSWLIGKPSQVLYNLGLIKSCG